MTRLRVNPGVDAIAQPVQVTRRQLLAMSSALPWMGVAGLAGLHDARAQGAPRSTLVAYYSRTGNTRVLARQIRRARNAELFEILPVDDYPEDYAQTVAQAARERQSRHEPPLLSSVPNLAAYDTVYLGFPIWGQSVPAVIRSFLSRHDLAGKALIPFITHGGYGAGDSQAVLAAHAPKARLQKAGLVLRADQERDTLERVTRWLDGTRATN